MSKNTKQTKKQVSKNKKNTKTTSSAGNDLLTILDNYFTKKQKVWFWLFFAVSVLFTFLLFDLRVSVGGDDSIYIIRANDFIKDFKYPSFQGPLYPMVLSIFIGIFGINLFILKLLSAIFLIAHLYFLFVAFKDRIPSSILLASIFIIAINSYLLSYGSQTYSEALFLMAQMLFFIYFFKHFIDRDNDTITIKEQVKKYLILGLLILALGLIKSVGFAALFAVIVYFAFVKKWKAIGFATGGFFVSFGLWQLIKYFIWHDKEAQFSSQANTLFQKHPYDASQGMETFRGFIQRFLDNSDIYLSRQFFKVISWRPELIKLEDGSLIAPDPLAILTISVYALLFIAFIWAVRQNKYLLFTGVFLAVIMSTTFILLQTIWEGTRLIIAFLPLLILYLITGIYYLFKDDELKLLKVSIIVGIGIFTLFESDIDLTPRLFRFVVLLTSGIIYFYKAEKLRFLQVIFPLVVIILFFSTLSKSTTKIGEHQKVFQQHLRGNITAGMTPDWANYVNMCKWAAKNIPKDKEIACRKPGIAFVYTNRRFQGIYKIETENPDSLLNYLYEKKIEYVIMASLRKFEARKTQYTINTIQRYLYYIAQKYPDKIIKVNEIGTQGYEPEPAYLFKIER